MNKIIVSVFLCVFLLSAGVCAGTIKNLVAFLGYDKDRKAVIVIIETSRKELTGLKKTETSVKIKYLSSNKIQNLYEDSFISDESPGKFGFKKNILINILEQNQIEIGTTGLAYNFNIISLAQKKRATYSRTINEVSYKYYINTAFFGKDGPPQKGNLLFLEAESKRDNFDLPEIVFMTDNLFKSWFLAQFSKNSSAVLFSDAADYFKTSTSFKETNKSVSVNMEKGVSYNRSALFSIPELKHTLELNSTSELEEPIPNSKRGARIYVFSEGYAQTRDGMTSIFGIRILNKKN